MIFGLADDSTVINITLQLIPESFFKHTLHNGESMLGENVSSEIEETDILW